MKIVCLYGRVVNPGDLSWSRLEALGDLTVYGCTDPHDPAEIIRRIGNADVVITSQCPIDRAVMDACPNLKCICSFATGYDIIDCKTARERGIPVCNVPVYGTASVAQHTIALLLELCCLPGLHNASVHNGEWASSPDWCYWKAPLTELDGKTIGIIGCGQIGLRTARIAAALGMKVLGYNHHPKEVGKDILTYTDLDTLLSSSDVISLHTPLTPETRGIICEKTIAKMKDGVLILNTSRGPLVDERALASALHSGKVGGAGLDVVAGEPIRPGNVLLDAPNCILTPHIAWAPKESRRRLLDITIDNVESFIKGTPINVVN